MGLKCTIEKERGGHCTGWDGKLPDGKNAWRKLESVVDEIPCDTCKKDGKLVLNAAHDVVNLTIGETTEAYDPRNLLRFQKRVNAAVNACTNCKHEAD